MFRKAIRPLTLLLAVSVAGMLACGDDDDPVDPGTAPGAPTSVDATVDGTSATITWTAGSDATSHNVVLSTSDEDDRTETAESGTNEVTFDELTEGATYAALVTALNDVGQTPAASPLALTIGEEQPEETFVLVNDDVLDDVTWTADKIWVLRGPIFVGRDIDGENGVAATLTIEPGTTILGDVNPPQGARGSYIVVSRGSQIIADANANEADPNVRPDPDNVIVFTSSAPRGERARGDWGGLMLNGRAPINSGPEAQGEGESGLYGGDDPMDNSGILRGVRVEFAGDRVTASDELNGIAPQGVGAGTVIDYVQIHYNVDDGIEPFGGTVSATHVVVTGIGDDSVDGTDGYQGFMQFIIGQQRADEADQGFELSNNADDGTAAPHSTAVVANATMIGAGAALGTGEVASLGSNSDIGVNLREGSNYRLLNNIIVGYGESGFCVEGGDAAGNADNRMGGSDEPAETLRFENNILFSNGDPADDDANFNECGGYTQAENMAFFEAFDNIVANPNLPDEAFNVGSMAEPPNVIPSAMPDGYTAFDVSSLNDGPALVMPEDGRTLVATDYAGAVEPGIALEDAWYYGWTVWSTDGSDSRANQDGN